MTEQIISIDFNTQPPLTKYFIHTLNSHYELIEVYASRLICTRETKLGKFMTVIDPATDLVETIGHEGSGRGTVEMARTFINRLALKSLK